MQNTKITTCTYKNTNAKYEPHQSVLCSGLVKSQHIGNRTPRPLPAPPPSPMKITLIYMIIIVVFDMIVFKEIQLTRSFPTLSSLESCFVRCVLSLESAFVSKSIVNSSHSTLLSHS